MKFFRLGKVSDASGNIQLGADRRSGQEGPGAANQFADTVDLQGGIVRFLAVPGLDDPDAVGNFLVGGDHIEVAAGSSLHQLRGLNQDRGEGLPLAGLSGEVTAESIL